MTITGPTTFYHRDGRTCVVRDTPAFNALGPGWADTPAAFYVLVVPPGLGEPDPDVVAEPVPAVCGKRHADGRVCAAQPGHRGAHTYRGPA